MMINRKSFITGLLLIWSSIGYSQGLGTYFNHTVNILEITDSILQEKLDSFIEFEKKCDYYTSDLVFGIHIQVWIRGYFITIASDDGLGTVSDNNTIYGGFTYKDHYIEVATNPDVDISIKKHFFKKTDKKVVVKRYEPFNGYDSTGILILESAEDDSFSYHRYFYQKGIFKIYERHTYCEQK